MGTITQVTGQTGVLYNEYSYDAWGRRRNFTNWTYTVAAQTDLLPGRGFTGHEWLPWFNLYNMNGRLYDPDMNGRDHCSRRFRTCILF